MKAESRKHKKRKSIVNRSVPTSSILKRSQAGHENLNYSIIACNDKSRLATTMDLIEREKILHGDEGEDEEDDLIVYKEQTEVPFCLSQPSTVTNTRAENRGSYPYPVAASKSRMSRYERRKRRHRWQERQQYPKTAPTPETPMVELDNDDPFAALQSLLGGPSQSQDTEKENHTFREERNKRSPARQMCLQQTTKPDVEMQPQHASSQQEKHRPVPEQQRDDIAEGMELSQSQPDFIFFDGDVDEEENDTGTLEEHFTRSRRDSSYQPRTKKERNEKMKKARKSAPAGILPEPEFVGPQSSRMKRGSKRSEGKSHKTKTQSSVPQQNQLTTTQVKISRSIVGSR